MNASMNPCLTSRQRAGENRSIATLQARLPAGCLIMAGFGVTLINFFWFSSTTCLCGHSSWITMASVLPSFLVMLSLQIAGWRNPLWERLAGLGFLLIQLILLGRNAADILWLGQTPLMPRLVFGG